jgi:hypothetical protein
MQTQAPTSPSPDELKRQIEAATGRPVDVNPEQLIWLRYPAGSYAYLGVDENPNATWKNLLFDPPPKYCTSVADPGLLEVCGVSSTGADGKRVFLLSDVWCPQLEELSEPINVVVTPLSENPYFVTMTYSLVGSPGYYTDLQITVFAWNTTGTPAAAVPFHWRCRVVSKYHPV